jgi:hypothetical protein
MLGPKLTMMEVCVDPQAMRLSGWRDRGFAVELNRQRCGRVHEKASFIAHAS